MGDVQEPGDCLNRLSKHGITTPRWRERLGRVVWYWNDRVLMMRVYSGLGIAMKSKIMGYLPGLLLLAAAACGSPARGQSPVAGSKKGNLANMSQTLQLFERGMKNLSSQKYATRQAGSADIRQAIAILVVRMMQAGGPERTARVDHLLTYQGDLTRWARSLLHLPVKKRLALLQWGLAPQRLPLVAGVFSHNPQRRAEVAHPLAKIPGLYADWLLERLLKDSHRLVYITAMDAVWNRKPTEAMVKTLWRRAVLMGMSPYFQQNRQYFVMFRGQRIMIQDFNQNYWMQLQDGTLAARVLAHWKPPQLSILVRQYLAQVCRVPQMQSVVNQPNGVQAKNFAKLAKGLKRSMVAPYLLYLLKRPLTMNMNFNFNNTLAHLSNRTLPLLLLVKMAGLSPATYHFYKVMPFGGVWGLGTTAQENQGIKKITVWYAQHGIKPVNFAHPAAAKPRGQVGGGAGGNVGGGGVQNNTPMLKPGAGFLQKLQLLRSQIKNNAPAPKPGVRPEPGPIQVPLLQGGGPIRMGLKVAPSSAR